LIHAFSSPAPEEIPGMEPPRQAALMGYDTSAAVQWANTSYGTRAAATFIGNRRLS